MSKRKRYMPEYKREIVDLVRRSQSSCRQIALEVGLNPNMLTRWVREQAKPSRVSGLRVTRRLPASSASCRRSLRNGIF